MPTRTDPIARRASEDPAHTATAAPREASSASPERSPALWLPGAVLAALAVRGTLLWLRGDYLDYDEAMYLLLARSLIDDGSFLLNGVPHTALGPLVPLATAALTKSLGLELLTAQRALSATAGALLLLPAWSLLRPVAGPRVARLAVTLLVVWPALIDVAPKFGPMWSHMYVGSEPTHLLLLFSALAVAEAALRRRGRAALLLAAAAGGLLGLAYLARAEAVVFGAVYAVVRGVQAMRRQERRRHVYGVAGLAATGFLVVATPHLNFLHRATGFLFLVPALALWAASGLDFILEKVGSRRDLAARLFVSLLLGVSLVSVAHRALGERAIRLKIAAEMDRAVAEDLSAALPDVDRFMHWHPRIAHWAGWEWRPMPVAGLDAIAHYCSRIGVGHVLLGPVGHNPLRREVPYLVIVIEPGLLDALRATAAGWDRPHEHPSMRVDPAPAIAGYPTASLHFGSGG